MIVILDLETQKSFSQVNKADPKELKVSFVGILKKDGKSKQYLGFWEKDLEKLWPILEKANLIVGFNLKSFDYPVLSAYYPGDLSNFPTLDILEEFKKAAGHRIGLDKIAQPTLDEQKTGDGAKAIYLYNEGRLDELKKYCFKDVEITYKIYEHGKKFGFLKYINKWNNTREVKVNFKKEDKSTAKIQMTLGG